MNEQQIRRAVEMWNRRCSLSLIANLLKVSFTDVTFLGQAVSRFITENPGHRYGDPINLDANDVVASVLGNEGTSPDQAEKPLTRNQRIIQGLRSGAPRKGKFVVSWESGHGVSGSVDHADEDRARETFARIVLCSVAGTRVSWVEDGAVVARCVVEDL